MLHFFSKIHRVILVLLVGTPATAKAKVAVGSRVTYTYDKAGTYTVTLTLANSCDDNFTTTRQITVSN